MSSRSDSPEPRAALVEIFHSLQGEGRFVGVPMTFVRVATCPLRCSYCDTPESYTAQPEFPVHFAAGARSERNPVGVQRAAELVLAVQDGQPLGVPPVFRAVSVTGGEPLAYPEFVAGLGAVLRTQGMRLHLETAAIDAVALARCLPAVEHVSADWKLPHTVAGADHGDEHVACVRAAVAAGRSLDVKIVLTADGPEQELEQALERLVPWRDALLLVLQPVTPFGAVTRSIGFVQVARAVRLALARGFDVRVLPQMHKQLGIR